MDSKNYNWRFVTKSGQLTDQECELVYAHLVPSAATTTTVLYSGNNAGGDIIVSMVRATIDGLDFSPPVPVYCPHGLYVTVGTNVTGVFVQWRNL